MSEPLKLRVLRKVEGLDERTYNYFVGTKDLVAGQFVKADSSWDDWATQELIKATVGWAVATPEGEVLAEFKTGVEATNAALGAKIDIKRSVSLDSKPAVEEVVEAKPEVQKTKKKA